MYFLQSVFLCYYFKPNSPGLRLQSALCQQLLQKRLAMVGGHLRTDWAVEFTGLDSTTPTNVRQQGATKTQDTE